MEREAVGFRYNRAVDQIFALREKGKYKSTVMSTTHSICTNCRLYRGIRQIRQKLHVPGAY